VKTHRLVAAYLLLLIAQGAEAAIYRCELPGGKTEYQSVPCSSGKATALGITESREESGQPAAPPLSGGAEPQVIGSDPFRERVSQALSLLRARDASAYMVVTGYVGRIEQAPHSGMRAYGNPPTFLMSDATAMHSLTWAAAAIAHDSYHSKLYHDYKAAHQGDVPRTVWSGTQAEIKCMRHQLAVMRRIGSSQWDIDHSLIQADGHYINDGESLEERNRRPY
jgi:hypothetical protein